MGFNQNTEKRPPLQTGSGRFRILSYVPTLFRARRESENPIPRRVRLVDVARSGLKGVEASSPHGAVEGGVAVALRLDGDVGAWQSLHQRIFQVGQGNKRGSIGPRLGYCMSILAVWSTSCLNFFTRWIPNHLRIYSATCRLPFFACKCQMILIQLLPSQVLLAPYGRFLHPIRALHPREECPILRQSLLPIHQSWHWFPPSC